MTPVYVTDHVTQRVRERCPGVGANARSVVDQEVRAALLEGRKAVRKPRRIVPTGRRPRASRPSVRFAWNPSASRVYVLRRVRSSRGGVRAWLVATVLVPQLPPGFEFDDEAEEAAA